MYEGRFCYLRRPTFRLVDKKKEKKNVETVVDISQTHDSDGFR